MKHSISHKQITTAIGLIAISTFASNVLAQTNQLDDEANRAKETRLEFSQELLDAFGVKIEQAGNRNLAIELILPGEIKLDRDLVAHVSPRYISVVQSISARLGDSVKAGQSLAVLQSTDTLVNFELKAPITGTIVEYHITLGESVEAGHYLFIIANMGTVWSDIDIYQKDLPLVKKGQAVVVEAGNNHPPARGIIAYLGPVVNEETRTGLARVILDNADGMWKPGMFISARVELDTTPAKVAVKRSSIQKLDGETVVFVGHDLKFELRKVILGRQDTEYVEVLSGIESGESYVSERSFLMKAETIKSTVDPHAGHSH
ncbi:MAG: efflux RND transporter periplasmic adaptor subunit [Verrucomicrobia bacterium]|nr:efflux RND transporter periplasmic adaptor subunit [Verrucomicrobiota bacterium]